MPLGFNAVIAPLIAPYTRQPDARTCQSACIAQMLNKTSPEDVFAIRAALEKLGVPGDPGVMESYLKPRVSSYRFDAAASLDEARKALDGGFKLITHSYLTNGHVISIVGWEPDPTNLSYRFIVDDPWSEFDFPSWSYPNLDKSGDNVRYSSYGMYAACVAGQNKSDAYRIYRKGELDSAKHGMWLHIVKN